MNVDQLKSSGVVSGTDADAFEDAADDDLNAFDDGAVPIFSDDADDDDLNDDDVYDLDDDEEIEDEDYGSFSRRFYYGQIPQFVIDEFGLTPEIMEKNKA